MRSSTFIFALAGAAAAETVNMMLPFGEQPYVAKSIGGNADATTYVLGCKIGTDANDCGVNPPMVVVQGPKTMAYTLQGNADMGVEGDFSYEQKLWCSLDGTTKADCTFTADGPLFTNTAAAAGDGSMPQKSGKEIITGTDMEGVWQKVTVVTDTASIQGYGLGMDGKPTSYEAAAKAIETGAAETGMVTSKASLPTQTGAVKSLESVVSSKTEAAASSASAAASSVAEGFAAQVTGLGAAAFAAVAGVMAMAAL